MSVIQVRRMQRDLWVVTDRGDDSPLGGPDRLGNHANSFNTSLDAAHAAQWRVENGLADRVERGGAL